MYKGIIVCDTDGTLLPFGHRELPQSTREMIERLIEDNWLFCVASGRSRGSLLQIFGDFEMNIVLICNNGGAIYDKGELISKRYPIAPELADELVEELKGFPDIGVMIDTEEEMIPVAGLEPSFLQNRHIQLLRTPYKTVELASQISEPIMKITMSGAISAINTLTPFYERWGKRMSVAFSSPVTLDFCMRDKGEGMMDVAKHYSIPRENIYAFGDHHNDVPMLLLAGHPYIMDCAPKELLNRFCNRCGTVDEVCLGLLNH